MLPYMAGVMRCILVLTVVSSLCGLALASPDAIAGPFSQGVSKYGQILEQLTGDEIQRHLSERPTFVILKAWSGRLRDAATEMEAAFGRAKSEAEDLMNETGKENERLALESSRIDGQITEAEKKANDLQTEVDGTRRKIATAEGNLAEKERSLASRERAVDSAQRSFDKMMNKCVTGRRRRRRRSISLRRVKRALLIGGFIRKHVVKPVKKAVKSVGDAVSRPIKHVGREIARPFERGGLINKLGREVARPFESGGLVNKLGREFARPFEDGGLINKAGREFARPFEAVGEVVERGLCRGVASATGKIKEMKRLRSSAKRDRDAARRKLHTARGLLSRLNNQLSKARGDLARVRGRKATLERSLNEVRARLDSGGRVMQDLNAAIDYLGNFTKPSQGLIENTKDYMDVENVLLPLLSEIKDVLGQELKVGSLPHIPRLTSEQRLQLRRNLEALEASKSRYPQIYAKELDEITADSTSQEGDEETDESSEDPVLEGWDPIGAGNSDESEEVQESGSQASPEERSAEATNTDEGSQEDGGGVLAGWDTIGSEDNKEEEIEETSVEATMTPPPGDDGLGGASLADILGGAPRGRPASSTRSRPRSSGRHGHSAAHRRLESSSASLEMDDDFGMEDFGTDSFDLDASFDMDDSLELGDDFADFD